MMCEHDENSVVNAVGVFESVPIVLAIALSRPVYSIQATRYARRG